MARTTKRGPAAPRAIVRIRPADVVNGRTLTDEQSAVFKDAVETLKRGEETEDAAMANRGRQRLRAMARDLGLLNEMDKAFADLSETALTRLRMNDDVRAGGAGGRVRVWDGIDQAHRNGDLDGLRVSADSLLALGTTYRQAFVATMGLLTPERQEVRGSGGGAEDAMLALGRTLATMRERQTPAHVDALDQICGWDNMIGKAAKALRRDPRTIRRLLREALETAAESMGVT